MKSLSGKGFETASPPAMTIGMPFFRSLRRWQADYKGQTRNGLAPCPNRDHHADMEQLVREYRAVPTDGNAVETLTDPGYTRGLEAYNREYEAITGGIWEDHYQRRRAACSGTPAPLPHVEAPERAAAVA